MKHTDKTNEKRTTLLKIMAAYASVMLLILIAAVANAKGQTNTEIETVINEKISTEYIYISKNEPPSSNITDNPEELERYFIKEYMNKIGIFNSEGTLIDVIEVYTKTLPEADRRLLGEGFEVIGRKQLNSIIEDYS